MSEHVGIVIKALREAQGMSKSRLGREASVSNAYIVQIEKGDRSPSEDVLRRLAHVLRVPDHALLVPAGHYTPLEVSQEERGVDDQIARLQERGVAMPDDVRDRLLAEAYYRLDGMNSMTAEQWEASAHDPLYSILHDSPEEYWAWGKPLPVLPLEHWEKLSDSDRRLIQRLANRLARVEETED